MIINIRNLLSQMVFLYIYTAMKTLVFRLVLLALYFRALPTQDEGNSTE